MALSIIIYRQAQLWIFWVDDKITGHGYLKCTLLVDFDINNDNDIDFNRNTSIPIETDYTIWHQKVVNN